RLAGDEDLDRTVGVGEQCGQPVGPAEEKARALVRREAAREADREHVRVEVACSTRRDDEVEQPLLCATVSGPQVLRRQLPRTLELRRSVSEQHLELGR